jgi:hypothetical protein
MVEIEVQNNIDIQNIARAMNMSIDETIMLASVRVAQSARAICVPGERKRNLILNPNWQTVRKLRMTVAKLREKGKHAPQELLRRIKQLGSTKYFIEVLRQPPKEPAYIPTMETNDPQRVITRRGLAQNLWNILASRINFARKARFRSGTIAEGNLYSATKSRKEKEVEVRITANLSYLEKAYPGIAERALNNATAKLEYEAVAYVTRAMQ